MKRANSSQILASSEFHDALQNEIFLKGFKDYCQGEYNVENLLFWLEVESFRQYDGNRREYAIKIYEAYVSPEGPLQINISQQLRTSITWPLPDPIHPSIFDELQGHIFDTMKIDSLPRFIKTEQYRVILNLKDQGFFFFFCFFFVFLFVFFPLLFLPLSKIIN